MNKRCPICHQPFTKKQCQITVQEQLDNMKWGKKIKYHPYCLNQKDRGIVGEIHL